MTDKFLSYKAFESFYPHQEESFLERFDTEITEFEKRLEKEIEGFDRENFWEDMMELDKEHELDHDLTTPFSEWWKELYVGKYNSDMDDHEVTPEYLRIEKMVNKLKIPLQNYSQKRRVLRSNLMKNAVEKHWNEWKAIYQKWIDFLKQKRGHLAGRRFGL